MAVGDEDLVALILSALGAASGSELCVLSDLLASESSLQLQCLWLLVGSPSRCVSIISFLDSLSHQHRRLLLARVTLRLVSRITDFLEDPAAASAATQQPLGRSDQMHADTACHSFESASLSNFEPPVANSGSRIAVTESSTANLGTASCLFESVSWTKSSSPTTAGVDSHMDMARINCEDERDNSFLPWGETDAAFLFLFLWETQEQECQEAMQRWCIDPFVYHLLILQEMTVLVDDKKNSGRMRAPRWRERLQQYLQKNVLHVGYGFPGTMALANLPASLGAHIDTIGRFQRILKIMDLEANTEERLPAASTATLHSLPTTIIGLTSEDKGKVCIICKEELEPSSVASQLPCMHVYHWDCILSWLKQRNNCPVCRRELPTDDYVHELQRKIRILRDRVV